MSLFLICNAKCLKCCLVKKLVNVSLKADERIVQCAGGSSSTYSATEWTVWTCVWSFEEVMDFAKRDLFRRASEGISTTRSTRSADDSSHGECSQYLCNEWSLESSRNSNFFSVESRYPVVINFRKSADRCDCTFCLLSVQRDLLCRNIYESHKVRM